MIVSLEFLTHPLGSWIVLGVRYQVLIGLSQRLPCITTTGDVCPNFLGHAIRVKAQVYNGLSYRENVSVY